MTYAAAIRDFLRARRPIVMLMGIVLALTLVPILDTYLIVGDAWRGILPTFTDETIYLAHVQTVGEGYLSDGNPYFLEHRNDPPLVIFGGAWLNAVPLLAGMPLNVALMLNFILWSLLFAVSLYWLLREFRIPSWLAVFTTVLVYLQSYAHVWRPANLQPVYPFYFLFYIALARLIREQSRRNITLLALATGALFYLFAYLWQIAIITLGLLLLYALVRKDWPLAKATFISSLIGGLIGLPVPLYMLWISHASPYFWESISRFGLVSTHLPMAEIIYSGGWIGLLLVFLAVLYWRSRPLRGDEEFILLGSFIAIGGLGLWVMQGSNLITGKLLETGEHVRILMLPWLAFSTVIVGMYVWRHRVQLSGPLRLLSAGMFAALLAVNLYYTYYYFAPFFKVEANREFWQTEQSYAAPFAWLQHGEKAPVVVWSDPSNYATPSLPVFTRHFTLFTEFSMWQLVSNSEFRERYLVSQYFNDPTVEDLKRELPRYMGRQDAFHNAKTIERGIKICRIFFFWDADKDCGTPPTSIGLLGEEFFTNMERRFRTDIKPNIKTYLEKYHVSYILKDVARDAQYHPEALGAVRVYADGHFEIYRLP
ncbi:MAG: hypothetical protein UY93_C0002G0024 [Parcubacteria group bacterium GW2011_GWA1_56_13]|nr:MAG: hypothetical protein UY93_C0002G0024 [Parcubacteria group bacterium GW2011_GWA1_56_13]